MVEMLGLKVSNCFNWLKAVNLEAQLVVGVTHAVSLRVGDWYENVTFLIVPLDDFDIILGNVFFVLAKEVPMPFLGGLLIMDEE
jgi:hypothetical protein